MQKLPIVVTHKTIELAHDIKSFTFVPNFVVM